jgi:hypothetical protein
MLVLLIVACIVAVRWLIPNKPETRPAWDRVVDGAVGLLECFGLVIGLSILLASVEFAKRTFARYQQQRIETKLSRLRPVLQNAEEQASAANLRRALRLLGDADPGVRQHALAASYCLRRADPSLTRAAAGYRAALEQALLLEPGFAHTIRECPTASLVELVTLGGKIGAGSAEKRISPVTSDAAVLARWMQDHRSGSKLQEIQVSIGYDCSTLPYLSERGKFIALYLYIVSTDLKRFQALMRRPARDPNAAFGLLIRGDVVEVRYPGQCRGRRLDYVFPMPRMSTHSLAEFLRGVQLLNLGLLLATIEDTCKPLFGEVSPTWLTPHMHALACVYRGFERGLVKLLRQHDSHRDPGQIHRLDPCDHAERVRAFLTYRLEECLYPLYNWVVPLYGLDASWERLLPALRAVEAMMLHQGEVAGKRITRGLDFIHKTRLLGYQTVTSLAEVLEVPEPEKGPVGIVPPDPFIDAADEEATIHYLRRLSEVIAAGQGCAEEVPDPSTFRKAVAYYRIDPPAVPLEQRSGP